MTKQAISITLDADNVLWLKGRAGAAQARSVSDLLDQLVKAARASGSAAPSKSVVGTIDIDAADPMLLHADESIETLFAMSLRRPFNIKAAHAEHGVRRKSRKRRG